MAHRLLLVCVVLCCAPGPASSRDGTAEQTAARRGSGPPVGPAVAALAEGPEDRVGSAADARLARLRTLERVLAMEVGAVDALSRVRRGRGRGRGDLGPGFLRAAEGMGMKLESQLEEVGEDELAEMRCTEAAAMNRAATSDAERERVCAFVDARCAPRTGFFNYLAVPFCCTWS